MTQIFSYKILHNVLRRDRGPASRCVCVDCDNRALDWSYTYGDPQEIRDDLGRRYSLDLSFYVPRCRRCHRDHDRRYLQAFVVELEPQIRYAVAEHKRAHRHNDLVEMEFWDYELDRLSALIGVEPLGRFAYRRSGQTT